MDTRELARRIKEAAYLEGDFVLRSGKRSKYYLDKYLFETQPDILAELGRRLADFAEDVEVIAGPELGAVALAARIRRPRTFGRRLWATTGVGTKSLDRTRRAEPIRGCPAGRADAEPGKGDRCHS